MAKYKKGDKFGTTQSAKYEILSGPHESNGSQYPLYTTRDDAGIVELKNESFLSGIEREE